MGVDLDRMRDALGRWEMGQRSEDEGLRMAWEADAAENFWNAIGMQGAQRQPRPPSLPGQTGAEGR